MNHKEPTVHKEVLGIIFEPADLKGILATVYHGAQFFISDKNAVGNAYHNNSEANSEEYYEDVLPHDFLNALYKTIDKGKMIEADLEPGDGVWNYPIFKYELSWQQTSATQAVGTIRLYFANDEVDVDSVFSTESVRTDIKTRDLEFSLQMPPGWDGKDLRQATSGAWIGASREQHPDALILSIDKNWRSDILEYLEDDDFAANINTELFQEMMLPGEALGSIVDFLISAYY
ncbi:MAG: hypothetical protein A2451_10530 [Bdellovibrionales bacterium RIFOXYC2_FULL_39_8]|nr:MAG: hypothetical protein A2451_10530 [Bdellovibrionales bacterium RIFOXYC2_FULL_39_8]